jgi:transposase
VFVTEDAMSKLLVTDDLWALVEPLLPKHEPGPLGGHPRVDGRVCLTGILFVLKSGIPWEDFPHEMGCCGMTLWNRLHEWHAAGVWPRLHAILLARMRGAGMIDFARAAADAAYVRAVHGGKKRGRARWTAASAGASTTCWSTPAARRWPRGSRPPTATTRPS